MTTTATHPSKPVAPRPRSWMKSRQKPLVELYREAPHAAVIQDGAETVHGRGLELDPVHGEIRIGTASPITAPVSVHSAVGGDHDGPNPGDYLCAALVGCFDTTLRIVADRLGVELLEVDVKARAEVDVRGTLCVDSKVPVGFYAIRLAVKVQAAPGTPKPKIQMLLAATEHCCVVFQTLKGGVEVSCEYNGGVAPGVAQ